MLRQPELVGILLQSCNLIVHWTIHLSSYNFGLKILQRCYKNDTLKLSLFFLFGSFATGCANAGIRQLRFNNPLSMLNSEQNCIIFYAYPYWNSLEVFIYCQKDMQKSDILIIQYMLLGLHLIVKIGFCYFFFILIIFPDEIDKYD